MQILQSNDCAGSGIEGLDEVLKGGFPRGQNFLIQGTSGTGKTTLCLQFLMEGARQGERTLFLGTSETEPEVRWIANSHGWSLDGVAIRHQETPLPGEEQTMLEPAEVELPQTVQSMLAVVEEVNPARVVIDSLAEIRALAGDELWYRRQLMALKRYFASRKCTVLLVEIPFIGQAAMNSIVSGVVELEQISLEFGGDRRRLRVRKIRGRDFTTGYHDYKIRRGGIEVFPRLIAAEHRETTPYVRVSSGIAELDQSLCGGLLCGTSTLLLGPSGTGKSVIATQYVVAAAKRGERSLMFSFDERVQTLFHRSNAIGIPLEPHVEAGLIEVRQVDPTELTAGEFSHAVKAAVEEEGIKMLVIDSLNGYAYAMPEEGLLTIYLHELSSYLSQKMVSAVFTMTQHGLVSQQITSTFDVSYIADSVILFRHFEYSGKVRKALSVYKNRGSDHETAIREFTIGPEGPRIGPPLDQFQGILSGMPAFLGNPSHADVVRNSHLE